MALSAPDFCALQASLGLSGRAVARLLGVHPNTVSNWRRGHTRVPGAVDAWLRERVKLRDLAKEMTG